MQLCVDGGTYPIYQSDEHGFLNLLGSWLPSPELVAMIGDSFTQWLTGATLSRRRLKFLSRRLDV